jgi:hypothetical protein
VREAGVGDLIKTRCGPYSLLNLATEFLKTLFAMILYLAAKIPTKSFTKTLETGIEETRCPYIPIWSVRRQPITFPRT